MSSPRSAGSGVAQRTVALSIFTAGLALATSLTLTDPPAADAATTHDSTDRGNPGAAASARGPVDRGFVTGTVVDRYGDPIAGALVNALSPSEVPEAGVLPDVTDRRDRTSATGRFKVRQAGPAYLIQICFPEPGRGDVCKEAVRGVPFMPTYVGPGGVTDSWVTQTSLFTPSATLHGLGTVTVKPQAAVHGRLTHGGFQSVQVQRLNGTAAWHGETDADGNYVFRGLAPGRYRIAAGGNGTGFLPYLSPVLDLSPRENATVDGVLRRGATIRGVASSRGKPAAGVDLLVRTGSEVVGATTTNASGRYQFRGLASGAYEVGLPDFGGRYRESWVDVTVAGTTSVVDAAVPLRTGATITVRFRLAGRPAVRARDELRDSTGQAVRGLMNADGTATYSGLVSGRYTVVAATGSSYGRQSIVVRAGKRYDLGTVRLAKSTLTLRGTTAPHAVVEAFSGNQCPPDGPFQPGVFHPIETADASGHYVLRGLVPGRWMVGADGWPHNYAPECIPNVRLTTADTVTRLDLPLADGGTVHGRLVYAAPGSPVILPLSYELTYPAGSRFNPTGEHPARTQARKASGLFTISGLPAGTATGSLAAGADLDQINDPRYFVLFPFQDGTPYYLTSDTDPVTVTEGVDLDLGDIELTLHG